MRWQGLLESWHFLGQTTIASLSVGLYAIFFAPGDYVLSVLLVRAPGLAAAAGIEATDYGSLPSATISIAFWFVSLLTFKVCLDVIRELLQTAIAWIRALGFFIMRQLRAARTMIRCWFGQRDHSGDDRMVSMQEIELDALETRLLNMQTELSPGFIITASEAARILSMTVWKIKQAFARLHQFGLVETAFGAGDGEDGYRLSPLGRNLATAQQRRRRTDVDIGNLNIGQGIRP